MNQSRGGKQVELEVGPSLSWRIVGGKMKRRRKGHREVCGGGRWSCALPHMDRIRSSWAREWEGRRCPSSLVEGLVVAQLDRGWWHGNLQI